MFKPKRAGDSILYPHQDHNAMLLAARAHRDSVLDGGTVEALPSWAQYERLPIKNNSGAARARFDILGIDGVIFEPETDDEVFENGPALKGITPATADHLQGQWAVLLEPAGEGDIVDGLLIGVTPARVNVLAAAHRYAEITDGQAGYLTSSVTGSAKIFWKSPGTGVKMCLVKMGKVASIGGWKSDGYVTFRKNPLSGLYQTVSTRNQAVAQTFSSNPMIGVDAPVVDAWIHFDRVAGLAGDHDVIASWPSDFYGGLGNIGPGAADVTLDCEVEWITTDWDPVTVVWGTLPTTQSIRTNQIKLTQPGLGQMIAQRWAGTIVTHFYWSLVVATMPANVYGLHIIEPVFNAGNGPWNFFNLAYCNSTANEPTFITFAPEI